MSLLDRAARILPRDDEFTNWSGNVRFTPSRTEAPRDADDVRDLVRRAREEGKHVRVAGSGHSFTPLLETDGVLVSTEHLHGVVGVDHDRMEATIQAGTEIGELGPTLREDGVTLIQLGDIDYQTLVGGMATATHGTGASLPHLGALLVGGRLVDGRGEIVEFDETADRELLGALRTSLGVFGVMTEVRVRLRTTRRLRRREWCLSVDEALEQLDELGGRFERVDLYWYPRRDEVKVRTWVAEDEARDEDAPGGVLDKDEVGWSDEMLPSPQENRYDEMEYMLPVEGGPDTFRALRRRILDRHRDQVAWRVLYRWVAGDDAYLSPMTGRDTVTIALLQNADRPFWPYFEDCEPIFLEHGGRPHWAKRHTRRTAELQGMYPEWETFRRLRREHDPNGVFLTPYLASLLEPEA
jgi:FAD/FMN-containing dehydrogenase